MRAANAFVLVYPANQKLSQWVLVSVESVGGEGGE